MSDQPLRITDISSSASVAVLHYTAGSSSQVVTKTQSLTLKNPDSWVMSVTESPGEIKCFVNLQHALQRSRIACSDFYYGGALEGLSRCRAALC